jgi:16S rRNA (guanine527-N7)-methyltransferase
MMTSKQLLKEGLNQIGFSYSEEQIKAFMTFLSELKKWNRAYNLTGLKSDKDIIIKHFLDSLLYLKVIPVYLVRKQKKSTVINALKIADAGTGAGFPGIPIKIMRPEIDITLIESSKKKTAFLRHILRVLSLNGVKVLDERVENLGRKYEKTYDVIVSRATFKIEDFIKKTCPYVRENGVLVLSKGPKVFEEIKELKDKGVIKEITRLSLMNNERNLLIFKCKK